MLPGIPMDVHVLFARDAYGSAWVLLCRSLFACSGSLTKICKHRDSKQVEKASEVFGRGIRETARARNTCYVVTYCSHYGGANFAHLTKHTGGHQETHYREKYTCPRQSFCSVRVCDGVAARRMLSKRQANKHRGAWPRYMEFLPRKKPKVDWVFFSADVRSPKSKCPACHPHSYQHRPGYEVCMYCTVGVEKTVQAGCEWWCTAWQAMLRLMLHSSWLDVHTILSVATTKTKQNATAMSRAVDQEAPQVYRL